MQPVFAVCFLAAVLGCPVLSGQSAERVGGGAAAPSPAQPQTVWQMQDSGTTAGLRGIDAVDGTNGMVAWASGTGGTVLRTTDGGAHWQHCATPDADKDGATLDFRGVQAWDAQTAIVMASGPGDKSRLYKTEDGCRTWKPVFRNPEKDGFWDTLRFSRPVDDVGRGTDGFLIGDPVGGMFRIFRSSDRGATWCDWGAKRSEQISGLKERLARAKRGEALFAASNASLSLWGGDNFIFVTGGVSGARMMWADERGFFQELGGTCSISFSYVALPTLSSGQSSGAFAIASKGHNSYFPLRLMAVGGDYTKPNQSFGTAVFLSSRDEVHIPWTSYFDVVTPITPPHGYRSAVQWSDALHLWITVGTNGSDLSRDDGKTWQPLDNGNWNALSLPFVVGPNGRIARIHPAALPKPKSRMTSSQARSAVGPTAGSSSLASSRRESLQATRCTQHPPGGSIQTACIPVRLLRRICSRHVRMERIG